MRNAKQALSIIIGFAANRTPWAMPNRCAGRLAPSPPRTVTPTKPCA